MSYLSAMGMRRSGRNEPSVSMYLSERGGDWGRVRAGPSWAAVRGSHGAALAAAQVHRQEGSDADRRRELRLAGAVLAVQLGEGRRLEAAAKDGVEIAAARREFHDLRARGGDGVGWGGGR